MPSAYDDLRALPGVGDYTAAAIATFGFGQRHVVLDTNVRRVLARLVSGVELPPVAATAGEKRLAESLLPEDESDAATWSVALDGARRAGVHGGPADVRRLPGRRRRAPGGRRATRRTTARRARRRPGRARTASAAAACSPCSATPRARCPSAPLDRAWDDKPQRDRCLASLLTDGLLVRVPEGYALPG